MRKKQKAVLMLFAGNIHDLEYDPRTQYKFHQRLTWLWFITMIILPFGPTLWAHSISALIIQEISLWANFATHFGAMSAAIAAKDDREVQVTRASIERLDF